MCSESGGRRVQNCNRLAKAGLIGAAVGFGSLVMLVLLPVNAIDFIAGKIVALVGVLLTFLSGVVLIIAIVARDLPTWKQNRWRFSLGGLMNMMFTVSLAIGSIVAAANGVSIGKMLLALGIWLVLSTMITWMYISWSLNRQFKEMNEQGRYLDWSNVAEHLNRGEGTILLTSCHRVPTLWWSDQQINTLDDARIAIDSDAAITICPKRSRIANWLKSSFPAANLIDLIRNEIHLGASD